MSKSAKPRPPRDDLTPDATVRRHASGFGPTRTARASSVLSSVAEILQARTRPIPMDELVKRVGARHVGPGSVRVLVQEAIGKLYQAVETPQGEVGWLTNLLQDNRIRHPLTGSEAERGFLLMDELEHACFFPEFFQTHRAGERKLQIELFGGPVVCAEAYIEHKTWSLHLGEPFVHWIEQQGGEEGDDILIMIVDAAAGEYTLRLHPREARDNGAIHNRNIQTALLAEELVRQQPRMRDVLPTWDLAASLIGQGVYAHSIPPDDLHCVLHQYSLLKYRGTGYTAHAPTGPSGGDGRSSDEAGTDAPAPPHASVFDVPAADFDRLDPGPAPLDQDEYAACDAGDDPYGEDDEIWDAPADFDAYQAYLDRFYTTSSEPQPLTLSEFSLLQAEFDALAELREEFGYLLSAQQRRQFELYNKLLLDVAQDLDAAAWEDDDYDASDSPDSSGWVK